MSTSAGSDREVDAVVVGGGASGLAAATWLARYRRSVVVMDSGDYRSASVSRSHGYLGRDPQVPLDLLARGREELLAYPTAEIRSGRVTGLERAPGGRFAVSTDGEGALLAHRVVIASGVVDAMPDVVGIDEHYGESVFHCPACDGYEARDRDVVVIGWDAKLVGFASTLLNWASSVVVVTDGRRFEGDETCRETLAGNGIEVVEQTAAELVGTRGDLTGLRLDGGRLMKTSLVFFSIEHTPRTDLAVSIGCELDDEGYVVVDAEGQTTVEGVYAAGDITPGLQLVQIAAASGAVAGVGAAQSLFGTAGAPASPEPAPDPTVPGQGG